jgi:hypothetical protein
VSLTDWVLQWVKKFEKHFAEEVEPSDAYYWFLQETPEGNRYACAVLFKL